MKIIDEKLLDRFRGQGTCEMCLKYTARRHPHHVRAKGMGGGGRVDRPTNLIGVCPECHFRIHNGAISLDDVLYRVARRENTTPEAITDEINLIRRTHKGVCQ